MEYTRVGNIRISKLALGTAQLGFDYGIANKTGKPSYQKSHEILKIAADNGVNCFDTAPSYGDSEKLIGSFLASYHHFSEPPLVVTKLSPINLDGQVTFKKVYSFVREQVTKSIEQTQVKRIPIYLLHRASDINAYDGLVTESLLRLRDEGRVGIFGVSVYSPEEVELALTIKAIGAIQVPVNIFDHRLIKTGLLNRLKDRSFIVFARSVFLQGLFFLDVKDLPPGLSLAREPLRQLQEFSHQQGMDIAELALRFVRDLPGITSIVIGAETRGQVLKNIDLMKSPPMTSGLREEIMSIFSNMPLELINPSLWNLSR